MTLRNYLLLLLPMALLGCGGDDKKDDNNGGAPSAAPVLVSSNPANGATEVPLATKQIVLTYDQPVRVSGGMELNGETISLLKITREGATVTVKDIALKRDQKYTLVIPEGCITSADGKQKAPEHTVSFAAVVTPVAADAAIASTLVTSNPSPEAVNLYEYLKDNYRKVTLSSTIASVNWNFSEAELVYKATGKYPAIATMDYIHLVTMMSRSPYSGWRINYDNITKVKEWWDNNGLVSACWHWNVPLTSGSKDYTCTPGRVSDGQTEFRPKNIFVDGTWENTIAHEDLEQIAECLLLLKDANIPVIWRPLHEASGNYNSGGSAWFWWGIDGPETFKQLWRYMFDYFKSRGINNLIWVWTTQTGYGYDKSRGILDDYDWYPGDEYVDVVGRDEYTLTAEQSLEEFAAISKLFPNKMITLSECGSVADMASQWESGAEWMWFMPWYDYDVNEKGKPFDSHGHANTAWWKATMASEYVITRDELPSLK